MLAAFLAQIGHFEILNVFNAENFIGENA